MLSHSQKHRRVNPYFRPQSRKSVLRLAGRSLALVGGVALVLYLLYGSLFRISLVQIEGASEVIRPELEQWMQDWLTERRFLVFPRRQRWFLGKKRIEEGLYTAFPLSTVSIDVSGKVVTVRVTEKIHTFFVERGDVLYTVDREGVVIGDVEDLERIRLSLEGTGSLQSPMIIDRRAGETRVGEVVISPVWLGQIIQLFDQIQSRTLLTPRKATLVDAEGRVDIETDAGVLLYIALDKDIDAQIQKLTTLIDRRLVDVTQLMYIDLRFTNRLFYN